MRGKQRVDAVATKSPKKTGVRHRLTGRHQLKVDQTNDMLVFEPIPDI